MDTIINITLTVVLFIMFIAPWALDISLYTNNMYPAHTYYIFFGLKWVYLIASTIMVASQYISERRINERNYRALSPSEWSQVSVNVRIRALTN